jgi:endo-1,4-beta-xylanase
VWHQIRPGGMSWRRVTRWSVLPITGLLLVMVVGVAVAGSHPALAATTLRQAAEAKGIKFGTALSPSSNLSGNAKYMGVASSQFDVITPGNEMKWGSVEPTQGQFNWTGADQLVAFAQANNQGVRGHNLVWHSQLPNFVNSTNFPTSASVLQVMNQHIATEAGRFKGKVISWDVVNEPFNEDGSLRNDIFEQATNGPGYIAQALTATHQADPNAKLYLNDFNIEGVNAKSNAMLALVQSLKQQGVPIDAVGFESHFILGQVPSTMQQNIARFVAAGVAVWITELDDRIQLPASSANLAQQATDYANVVKACLAVTGCVGITVWGFTDLDSWIPGAFPGQGAADIYDNNIDPKASFNSTLQALGAVTQTPTPTPTGTPTTRPPTPTPTPTATPTPTPTGGGATATPVVASSGPFFDEEDVKLASASPITALSATIVVQTTGGVTFSSQYNTFGQLQQGHSSTASAITYTFTLAAGQTLQSTGLVAAQMGGSGQTHPTTGDTFTVTTTSGGITRTQTGHF